MPVMSIFRLLSLLAIQLFAFAQETGMVTDYATQTAANCAAGGHSQLPPSALALSASAVNAYRRDGYYIARGLLSSEEVALVRNAMEEDPSLKTNTIELGDEEGGATLFSLWSNPGNGTLGALTRSSRVVQSMRSLLGGDESPSEVLHYHSKSLTKQPGAGGVWNWHQDYGYWYKDFFLLPHLATAYFAIDSQTHENGAFTVLNGSHELGRVDHWTKGDQQGADLERVELAKERYEEVVCELQPGDCIFFNALLLHTSKGNFSPERRMAFASVFTRADNIQWKKPYIPCWAVDEVSDDMLMEQGLVMETAAQKVMLGSDEGRAAGAKRDGEYEAALDSVEQKLNNTDH